MLPQLLLRKLFIDFLKGRDTGMVSSATGFLDFISYISASAASTVFANAVSGIGWKGLTLVWFGLMVAGILVALPKRAKQIA